MPNASPTGKSGKRRKPRTGVNPVPDYERRRNEERDRLAQGQVAETTREIVRIRDGQLKVINPDKKASTDLRRERQPEQTKAMRARATRAKLKEDLPPIAPPPGVLSPGSGLAGASSISAILNNGGGGVRAGGRAPAVDSSLAINASGSLKRATNAASVEFNPQLEAIRTLIDQTQNTGQRGIQQTGNAYGALQTGLQKEVPGINQTFDASQAKTAAIYAALNKQIQDQYGGTAARDTTEFERLGIQQANPVLQGQTTDRDFLSKIAALQGQSSNDSSELLQSGAAGSAQNNATMAGFAGVNAQTDQRNNLADALLKLRSQRTSIAGAKGKSIRELTEQYREEATAQAERDRAFKLDAQQFQESIKTNRRDFRYGKEMDRAKLGMDVAALQAGQAADAAKASQVDWDSLDPAETAAAKADQLVPGSGDRMFAYLQNLIRSNKDIQRGFYLKDDGTGKKIQVKMTAERFGVLAARNAKIAGLPKGSVQKIASTYWSER